MNVIVHRSFLLNDRCFVEGAIQDCLTFLAHEKRLAWIAANLVQIFLTALVMANAVFFYPMKSSLREFRRDTDTRLEFGPQCSDGVFKAACNATIVVHEPFS